MTLKELQPGIYLGDSAKENFDSIDGIIFDCDGVLIDVSKSYDATIIKTTKFVLNHIAGIKDTIDVDSKIIDGFKATGGFNDEVDLTYVSILAIYSAKKLGKNQREFIFRVIENSDCSGIISVENYLDSLVDISEIKDKLQYPGLHHKNPLYQIFDQLFYGPILYHKLFKQNSEFLESGFIENDKVIVNNELISKLRSKFQNKIGIVTGRGYESIKYSLKNLLDKFDLKNSAFLEDEPRSMAKPNPEALIRAIEGMKIKNCIYVGDSMEDYIMTKKATQLGHKTFFCGIIGTSKNPEEKLQIFEKNEANLVLESIRLLPKVLNLE